jgi:hypothetical protein
MVSHSKPGPAPGPVGILMDVWRGVSRRIYFAPGGGLHRETPPGFIGGGVASSYKARAKDAVDAANCRSLTMMGSDSRVLAKVLTRQWAPLLAAVVGPEQTVFLAGRRIADNI